MPLPTYADNRSPQGYAPMNRLMTSTESPGTQFGRLNHDKRKLELEVHQLKMELVLKQSELRGMQNTVNEVQTKAKEEVEARIQEVQDIQARLMEVKDSCKAAFKREGECIDEIDKLFYENTRLSEEIEQLTARIVQLQQEKEAEEMASGKLELIVKSYKSGRSDINKAETVDQGSSMSFIHFPPSPLDRSPLTSTQIGSSFDPITPDGMNDYWRLRRNIKKRKLTPRHPRVMISRLSASVPDLNVEYSFDSCPSGDNPTTSSGSSSGNGRSSTGPQSSRFESIGIDSLQAVPIRLQQNSTSWSSGPKSIDDIQVVADTHLVSMMMSDTTQWTSNQSDNDNNVQIISETRLPSMIMERTRWTSSPNPYNDLQRLGQTPAISTINGSKFPEGLEQGVTRNMERSAEKVEDRIHDEEGGASHNIEAMEMEKFLSNTLALAEDGDTSWTDPPVLLSSGFVVVRVYSPIPNHPPRYFVAQLRGQRVDVHQQTIYRVDFFMKNRGKKISYFIRNTSEKGYEINESYIVEYLPVPIIDSRDRHTFKFDFSQYPIGENAEFCFTGKQFR